MREARAREALIDLGFTELEAAVYCSLLQDGPATGYRVAKSLAKAPANVYSALSALAAKGAVAQVSGEGSEYLAAPPDQLVAMLHTRQERRHAEAREALNAIVRRISDDRTYCIASFDQAIAQAEQMIEEARSVVLLDLFPGPFERLAPKLSQAAERGVEIALRAYEVGATIPGAIVALHPASARHRAQWPGAHMNIVCDARRHIVALFDRSFTTLLHALASDSSFLACMQHTGLFAEIWRASLLSADSAQQQEIERLSLLGLEPEGLLQLREKIDQAGAGLVARREQVKEDD